MSGLTDAGFDKPTLAETVEEINDDLLARFGADVNLLPTSLFSQFVGVSAAQFDKLWQGLLDLYNGTDPDSAGGILLRYLAALVGLTILAATKSTVTLTVNLDASKTLPVGRLVSNPTTGVQFITTAAVTSTSSGNYSVTAESVNTGPVAAAAGSLTQIDTPVTGWNSVTNALDAVAGSAAETDAELRTRRSASLAVQGSTPPDAIRADTLRVTGVTAMILLENITDFTDANGLPPHSFEVVADGTYAAADLVQSIWDDSKATGIPTFGSSSDTIVDDEGNTQTVFYTVPSSVLCYVDTAYTTDENYPVDGDTQAADAIEAYGAANLEIGEDLFASALYTAVNSIPGVVQITALTVGIIDATVDLSVVAGVRDLLKLAAARVDVVST